MIESLRELLHRRDLLFMVAWRDIRVKYKESVMGLLWAVLMPVVIVSAGMLVKFAFAMLSGRAVHVLDVMGVAVKSVPYAFVVASIRFGTMCLITNQDLVTKIYLPRLVFPFAAVLSQLFDFGIASTVVGIALACGGVGVSAQLLWLPLLVLLLVLLATGLAVLLSSITLFMRDVRFVVEAILTVAIFFTPVFYSPAQFGARATVLLLNPLSPILEALAATVVEHRAPSLPWLAYSAVWAVGLFVGAIVRFRRVEPLFAENI